MRRFWTFKLAACFLVLLVGLTATSMAGRGGKGGGDALPVLYQIDLIQLPVSAGSRQVTDFNNYGAQVGYFYDYSNPDAVESKAYLYDPQRHSNKTAIDLNDVVSGIPTDKYLSMALRINDLGDFTGILTLKGNSSVRRGCIINMNATDSDGKPQPTLIEVPDAQFGSTYTWARDMNDWGDVVGVYRRDDQTYGAYIYNPGIYGEELGYDPVDLEIGMRDYDVHINNNGQIAGILTNGNAFRYTIAIDDMEQFSPTSDSSGTYTWETVADLNESGVFCGSQKLTYTKKQKGLDYTHVAYRFDNVIERLPFERRGYAVDINSSGDFVTALYGKIYLDKLGYFDINSLLDPTDEDAAIFLGGWPIQYPRINDRIWISADDITGFPCIAGHIMGADDIIYNYILTPVAPPASQ